MHLKTQKKKHRNKTTNQIFQLFEVTNLMKGKEDQRGRRGGNFATLYKQPQCWVNKVFVLEKKIPVFGRLNFLISKWMH